jgi:hypothetical protein
MMVGTVFLASACASVVFAQNGSQQNESLVASFDPDDFVSLNAGTGSQLVDVPVEMSSGVRIGTVKMVSLAPDGSAARVLVDLFAGGSVWIVADALRYNRNAQILLTNLKHIEPSADTTAF